MWAILSITAASNRHSTFLKNNIKSALFPPSSKGGVSVVKQVSEISAIQARSSERL